MDYRLQIISFARIVRVEKGDELRYKVSVYVRLCCLRLYLARSYDAKKKLVHDLKVRPGLGWAAEK